MVIELNILNIIPQLQLLHHKSDSLYPYTATTPKNMDYIYFYIGEHLINYDKWHC